MDTIAEAMGWIYAGFLIALAIGAVLCWAISWLLDTENRGPR